MGRKSTKQIADEIEETITEDIEENDEPEGVNPELLLPTGITLLDLACSDTIVGGISMGKVNTIPGGSSSGKTFLVFNTLAAIANDPRFEEYSIIYDDAEEALEFNISELFGAKLYNRLIAPKTGKDGSIHSNTIQEFKHNILNFCSKGGPFIYVLDSLDSLASDEEVEREYKEAVKAAKSEEHLKEIKGSYNTEKSRIIGQVLRMIKREIKNTNSSVNIVQQLRQNINAGLFGKKEITSGGNAPFYYSTHQFWTTKIASHKDSQYDLNIGQRVQIKVTKNKLTGKKRTVEIDLYDSMGFDNLVANVDFLTKNGFWAKEKQTIKAPELGIELTKNKLIAHIEENNLETEVDKIVEVAWLAREEAIKLDRKRRFV